MFSELRLQPGTDAWTSLPKATNLHHKKKKKKKQDGVIITSVLPSAFILLVEVTTPVQSLSVRLFNKHGRLQEGRG